MPALTTFKGKKLLLAIQAVMSNMEARYRRAFLDAIEDITNSPDVAEIITDLRNGSLIAMDARTLSRIQGVQVNSYQLQNAARQAFASGGRVTASTVGFEGVFNLQNPKAIQMARTISDSLADTLTNTVRQNLEDIIQDAVAGVDAPGDTVRRIKQEIGLSKQHAQAVKNYRKNLVQTGMAKARADKMAEQYAKRLLKYRAETIARTEVAIAVNKGQQVFWNQLFDEGRIPPNTQKVWIAEMDAKTCDICYPLNGMLAPVDGPWMTANGPYDIAHAHPRCRCTSGLVFPSKVQKDDPLGLEYWELSKGDYPGHPFRGNQWTRGTGGGRRSASDLRGKVGGGGSAKESAEELSIDEHKLLVEQQDKSAEGITGDEENALGQYFGDNYMGINRILREGPKPDSRYDDYMVEYAKHMETAFEKSSVPLPKSTVLYRGFSVFEDDGIDFSVGSVLTDKGYTSSSSSSLVAESYAGVFKPKPSAVKAEKVVLKIIAPKGTKVMLPTKKTGGYSGEQEILLDKGVKFKVVANEKVKGKKSSTESARTYPHTLVTVEIVP